MAYLYNPLIIANHITSIIPWENVKLLSNLPLRPLPTDNTTIKQQLHVQTPPALLSSTGMVQQRGYENVTSTLTLFFWGFCAFLNSISLLDHKNGTALDPLAAQKGMLLELAIFAACTCVAISS